MTPDNQQRLLAIMLETQQQIAKQAAVQTRLLNEILTTLREWARPVADLPTFGVIDKKPEG